MKKHRKLFAAFTAAMLAVSASGISAAAMMPPPYFQHSYKTAEEMADALHTTFTPELIEEIDNRYYYENEGGFEKALALWQENGVPVPCIKGEPMASLDETAQFSFFVSDLFEMPALYYNPEAEGYSHIVMQYLDDEQVALAQEDGINALMHSFVYDPQEGVEYPSYEEREELTLNVNGTETPAIVGRELDDERSFCHFVYDDLLIMAACVVDSDQSPDDFFRWMSFEKIGGEFPSSEEEDLLPSDEVIEEDPQTGDVNGNGEVDILDVVILNKALLGAEKLTKAAEKLVDVDGDGKPTAADSLLIMKYLVKLIPSLDAEELAPADKETAEIRIDNAKAITDAGWDAVRSDAASYVIKSAKQLETELQPLFGDAVTRSLKKTYGEKFFEENVLLFKLLPLSGREKVTVAEDDVTKKNGKLNVGYTYSKSEDEMYGAALVQIAVPRDAYNAEEVVWTEKDVQPVSITLETDSVYAYSQERTHDEAMIHSTQELKDFLSQALNENGVAVYEKKYPEKFFEKNTLYMKLAWGHAPGYECDGVAMKKGDTITVNAWKTVSYECIEQILHTAVLDKKDAQDAQVVLRKLNDDAEELHGEFNRYMGYYPGIYVNTYSFNDEYEMEIGWLLNGVDCIYVTEKAISVPMKDGYMPFEGGCEYVDNEEGYGSCIGKTFEIHWLYDEIVVKYKTAEDSAEMKTVKLNYPGN